MATRGLLDGSESHVHSRHTLSRLTFQQNSVLRHQSSRLRAGLQWNCREASGRCIRECDFLASGGTKLFVQTLKFDLGEVNDRTA